MCQVNMFREENIKWKEAKYNKEFSIDFIETCALRNNKTLVKEGDIIYIEEFTVCGGFYDQVKGRTIYININKWHLKDAYDYSKLNEIEYKGSDYEDDDWRNWKNA